MRCACSGGSADRQTDRQTDTRIDDHNTFSPSLAKQCGEGNKSLNDIRTHQETAITRPGLRAHNLLDSKEIFNHLAVVLMNQTHDRDKHKKTKQLN